MLCVSVLPNRKMLRMRREKRDMLSFTNYTCLLLNCCSQCDCSPKKGEFKCQMLNYSSWQLINLWANATFKCAQINTFNSNSFKFWNCKYIFCICLFKNHKKVSQNFHFMIDTCILFKTLVSIYVLLHKKAFLNTKKFVDFYCILF